MNATEEMKQARWELKKLSASDPAAAANMTRHVAALALLLAGRRAKDRRPGEPEMAAVFLMDAADREFMMHVTARTGVDQVLVGFDVDDPAGPPRGFGVVRIEGGNVVSYGNCRLWAPTNDGRPVLVPVGEGCSGHFAFRMGRPLRRLPGRPAPDLEAGFRRAAARFARIVASDELRDGGGGGFLHLLSNDDGVLSCRSADVAA